MAHRGESMEKKGGEKLENWEFIGSGGFGRVYKARHEEWGFDVAIKVIHISDCLQLSQASLSAPPADSLLEEAHYMNMASCEFVLKVYGIFQVSPPPSKGHLQQGIVMELVRGGSIQTLQSQLSGPLPKPLAFRLAHQVALGMNFLHLKNVVHHDLKPSNVLLTEDLNVKIADFGLSRKTASEKSETRAENKSGKIGGSYKYMPPEAFEVFYKAVRSFDRYSYGILLWSIFSGKDPYPGEDRSIVELRIPLGDRPCCEEIDGGEFGEMVELMKKCWDGDPLLRPTFKQCLEITEKLFSEHKNGMRDAVNIVLGKLESLTNDQQPSTSAPSSLPSNKPESPPDFIDFINQWVSNTLQRCNLL